MSEATCGGAQRNHTSVAGGDWTESQKPLKSKGLSRRPIPLQSRESPVRVNHTSVAGGDCTESQKPLKRKSLSRRPIPLQSRESPVRIDPGDSLLFENFVSLRHLQLYEGPSFLSAHPRRQRSCFAGRRCGCAFAH